MKGFVALISVGIAILVWITGCSREEEKPPPVKRTKIVKPIIKPPPEVKKNPVIEETPPPQALVKVPDTPGQDGREEKVEPPATDAQEKGAESVKGPGIYIVKKGESLSSISAQMSVYGDPLNWPILYRHNLNKLTGEKIEDGLPEKTIREGVILKILTPDELRDNLKERADHFWVINIVSATKAKEVVAPAIKLIKGGYLVYITSAEVKGKSYQRLRVGFFKTRREADVAGKKIMSLLNTTEFWPTKIEKKEHEAFAGY